MSKIINLPTHKDTRGELTVIENILPFDVKRIYYIYNSRETRGGHRHKITRQALICVSGSCDIYINDGKNEKTTNLSKPNQCLILEPEDWHTMSNMSLETVILVLASEHYDKDDYVHETYG